MEKYIEVKRRLGKPDPELTIEEAYAMEGFLVEYNEGRFVVVATPDVIEDQKDGDVLNAFNAEGESVKLKIIQAVRVYHDLDKLLEDAKEFGIDIDDPKIIKLVRHGKESELERFKQEIMKLNTFKIEEGESGHIAYLIFQVLLLSLYGTIITTIRKIAIMEVLEAENKRPDPRPEVLEQIDYFLNQIDDNDGKGRLTSKARNIVKNEKVESSEIVSLDRNYISAKLNVTEEQKAIALRQGESIAHEKLTTAASKAIDTLLLFKGTKDGELVNGKHCTRITIPLKDFYSSYGAKDGKSYREALGAIKELIQEFRLSVFKRNIYDKKTGKTITENVVEYRPLIHKYSLIEDKRIEIHLTPIFESEPFVLTTPDFHERITNKKRNETYHLFIELLRVESVHAKAGKLEWNYEYIASKIYLDKYIKDGRISQLKQKLVNYYEKAVNDGYLMKYETGAKASRTKDGTKEVFWLNSNIFPSTKYEKKTKNKNVVNV